MANVGYAFVNFISKNWAQKCMEASIQGRGRLTLVTSHAVFQCFTQTNDELRMFFVLFWKLSSRIANSS